MSFSPSKAVKSRVVLLAGEEEVLRRRAMSDVLAAAEVTPEDFDMQVFEADSSSPIEWLGSVSTAPFLSPLRVAVVRHLLRCDLDKLKGVDFGKLPETSLLLLVADEESGSDEKQKKAGSNLKNWQKVVTDAGGTVALFNPDPKAAKDGVKSELIRVGKTMSDRAIDALVDMTGASLSRSVDELEKLALYVGDNTQIREDDVRRVVVPSREWNVFSMVDAIVAGEIPEALRQLKTLMGSASKAETAAFAQILPQVSRALKLLWQARVCIEANCEPSNAPESVRRCFPEKPNIASESPYRLKRTMQTARRVKMGQLTRAFEILSATDSRLKGALASFTAADTLERMVLDLAMVLKS